MFKVLQFSAYRSEIRKTLNLAIPIIIGQLGFVMMGVTDNIIVGRLLGAVPLGAAALANSICFLIAAVAFGGLPVVSPLISKARAENNPMEINRLFRAAINTSLWFSAALTLMGIIIAWFFDMFQQTAEVTAMARPFFVVLLISNVFAYLFLALKQLPDGLSHTRVAMQFTILGFVINLVLNLLLIRGAWGIPGMGLIGSAYATLFTRVLMFVALAFYVFRSPLFKPYLDATFRGQKIGALTRHIISLGVPSGLQFFFEVAAFALAVVMMGWLGPDRLAAHQIVINISSITYMAASGLASGASIRVGHGRGEKRVASVIRSGNTAFVLVGLFMSLCIILMLGFKYFWVGLYIENAPDVTAVAIQLILIAALFQLSDGFQVVAAGALRGLSDVNIPTWITLVAYWGVSLPLGYYLAFPMGMDARGIWLGLFAGLTISAVLLTARFYQVVRRMV